MQMQISIPNMDPLYGSKNRKRKLLQLEGRGEQNSSCGPTEETAEGAEPSWKVRELKSLSRRGSRAQPAGNPGEAGCVPGGAQEVGEE